MPLRDRLSPRTDAVLIGLLAFALSVAAAGRPSLWADESATISAATLPVGDLRNLLGHVDAVHGLYYLLLHGWFTVFPVGEFWARVPSALMVGVAAAGTCVLGTRMSGRRVGIAAGVVFAVLPRTTWAGLEARPYALSIACAVWLTVLALTAMRRGGWRRWVGYAAVLTVAAAVNVLVLLILAAHAAMLAALRADRATLRSWAVATGAALVLVSPVIAVIVAQQDQVAWIWPVGPVTAGQIAGEQYFPSVYSDSVRAVGPDQQQFGAEELKVAVRAWARVAPLIVVIVAVCALAVRLRRRRGESDRVLVWTCAAWIVVPTLALVGYSLVARPLYQPHYLAFTTPAVALLVGLCAATVGRDTRRLTVVLAIIAVAAAPNYVAQRGPYAKFGSDYSQVAALLAERGGEGECVRVHGTPSAPTALAGARRTHGDALRPVGADAVDGCAVLWTVTDAGTPAAVPGFAATEVWRFNQTQVARSVRDRS
ncbi:hypothetical protein CYL16_20850 [Mycobacterium sp. EPG1]|nr:hypothetical protein CYL16_20850 [Mycobacterium sp. EPG1]